jgi:tetratricopeptide (TPR) repeat protein
VTLAPPPEAFGPDASPLEPAAHLFDRGIALRSEGRFGEALEAWEKALALAPENRLYESHVGRLRAQVSELRRSRDTDEPNSA